MRRTGNLGGLIVAVLTLVTGGLAVEVAPAGAGVVINVPASRPTIQGGIDAAANGDTVVVAPGAYFEHIDFKGKAIEVRSSAGAATTVIDGSGTRVGVTFVSGEGRGSVLRGFTITHGFIHGTESPVGGGGISMVGASPVVTDNVVVDNVTDGYGGGISSQGGSPLLKGNQVLRNHGGHGAGGLMVVDGNAEIVGNVVERNVTDSPGGAAGGLFLGGGVPVATNNLIRANVAGGFGGGVYLTEGVLIGNVIAENTGGAGGGVWWQAEGSSVPYMLNNTMAGNQSTEKYFPAVAGTTPVLMVNNIIVGSPQKALVWCPGPEAIFFHNDVYSGSSSPYDGCNPTGTNGNVSVDPLFLPGGYLLGPGSPAIDAGETRAVGMPTTDFLGHLRITDGVDGHPGPRVDLGAIESPTAAESGLYAYHSLTPARLLDTRVGLGAPVAKIGPGSSLELQVTDRGGVPADGVDAVVLNVAVTQPTAQGWLTAWPAGAPFPLAANLNFVPGQTVANLVVVKVGAGGSVKLFNSAGATDVVVDVAGWYGGPDWSGSGYSPLTPARILDTRLGVGAPTAKVGAGATLALQVTGQGGVPASGVTAVVLNLTATNTTSEGYLTAWPPGQAQPLASSLNFPAGRTVPNLVVVKLGDGGRVNLFNSNGTTDLVADVEGWFGIEGPPEGAVFHSVVPARILDTRDGRVGATSGTPAPLQPGGTLSLGVTGSASIPATGVAAVVLNVTVTGPVGPGYLTVWPAGGSRPLASNLNFVAGQTVPNLVVVPVGELGAIQIYTSGGPVDVVADLAGWYSP